MIYSCYLCQEIFDQKDIYNHLSWIRSTCKICSSTSYYFINGTFIYFKGSVDKYTIIICSKGYYNEDETLIYDESAIKLFSVAYIAPIVEKSLEKTINKYLKLIAFV